MNGKVKARKFRPASAAVLFLSVMKFHCRIPKIVKKARSGFPMERTFNRLNPVNLDAEGIFWG
jgi:hypothetical protein